MNRPIIIYANINHRICKLIFRIYYNVNANSLEERFERIAKALGLSEAEKEAFFRECEELATNDPAFYDHRYAMNWVSTRTKKTLPYDVYHEANFQYQTKPQRYIEIAQQVQCDPVIAALLDNLGILFATGEIAVGKKTTKAIERFADVVDASEAGLDGYSVVYKIKTEFEHHFIEEEIDIIEEHLCMKTELLSAATISRKCEISLTRGIDLIATDPPFNSNRNYFVPYRDERGARTRYPC